MLRFQKSPQESITEFIRYDIILYRRMHQIPDTSI